MPGDEAYLRDHFVDTSTCAALAGITVQRLDALIAAEAIPAPTYRCNAGTIHSAAFGSIDTESRLSGAFFRPGRSPSLRRFPAVLARTSSGW